MTLNPVETLNVFDANLTEQLRERSKSPNLLRTRAPFIRLTTGANMGNLVDALNQMATNNPSVDLGFDNGKLAQEYSDCTFFTLGLHGWDNLNYSATDLYGTKGDKGLVVGVTYKAGQQKLVYTFGGNGQTTDFRQNATVITGQVSAKNYPPPGITSAKVERLRNGNVLRFTVETQCYTQDQLQMLDLLCYVPGMTCVLEWGSVMTTPNGIQRPRNVLDFTNYEEAKSLIINADKISRRDFISRWCAPNNYNYDWVVANIANIKTRLENNIYKTTVIAYGKADNLMYISAYATSNPLNEQTIAREQEVTKSVSEYFKHNGRFANRLKNIISAPDSYPDYKNQVVRFNDPAERKTIQEIVPTAQQFGTVNDVGLEDAYFISFETFINRILNIDVLTIVNSGLSLNNKLAQLIAPLRRVDDTDTIYVGWNAYLRSTSPDVMIIYNPTAAAQENNPPDPIQQETVNELKRGPVEGSVLDIFRVTPSRRPLEISEAGATKQSAVKAIFEANPFTPNVVAPDSDVAPLYKGVWLNSKTIQQCFLNARTVMEGMEALLNRINAATENYWDLTLYFDDDVPGFRILDNNVRIPQIRSQQEYIYEFNKPLSSIDGTVIGPDVLDISISSDYPKLLFSQLAISGINNGSISGDPQRRDLDFKLNRSVTDLFLNDPIRTPSAVSSSASPTPTAPQRLGNVSVLNAATSLTATLNATIQYETYGTGDRIRNLLTSAFVGSEDNTLPRTVYDFINTVYANKSLLTSETARLYRQQLNEIATQERLSNDQLTKIKELLVLRVVEIIRTKKTLESRNFASHYRIWLDSLDDNTKKVYGDTQRDTVINNISNDKAKLIEEVYRVANIQGEVGISTSPEVAIQPGQIGGGAVPGRGGRGGP